MGEVQAREMSWAVATLWVVFKSHEIKLIHIENKYGEKGREFEGLSLGTLQCLEIKKLGGRETERRGSREPVENHQGFL